MPSTTITPDRAAELYAAVADPKTKWEFLDGVVELIARQPGLSQREVIDQIGDTQQFIDLHGHHRDGSDTGKKARSKLKSIRDEVSVVKVWTPEHRVSGVSFEAHKVLNRVGAPAGQKILAGLVKESGGPANVTKQMVANRLRAIDPDHKPQSNGKSKPQQQAAAAGNHPVTATPVLDLDTVDIVLLAGTLASRLTVGELANNPDLLKHVTAVSDVLEALTQRNQAKANAKPARAAKAPAKTGAARKQAAASSTRTKPQRSGVKTPKVKTPTAK